MADETARQNSKDISRARNAAAAVLFGLVAVGVCVNLATGQERFSIAFCIAILTAGCGLLGLNRLRLGG